MKKLFVAFSAVALTFAFSSCATTGGACPSGKKCCGKCGSAEKCCGKCGGSAGKCCGKCQKS